MATNQKEFNEALEEIRTFSLENLRQYLNEVELEMVRVKRHMSASAKALSKLRARKMAAESRLLKQAS